MKTVYNQSIDQHIDQWTELGVHKKILTLVIYFQQRCQYNLIREGSSFINGAKSVGYTLVRKKEKEEEEEEKRPLCTSYTKLNSKRIINPEILLAGIYPRKIFHSPQRHICKCSQQY